MICCKEHAQIQDLLAMLPISQGGPGRHKCAACAFEEGYDDGIKGVKRDVDIVLEQLPDGQAKNQRHKSCEAAYEKGYEIANKVKASLDFTKSLKDGRLRGFTFPSNTEMLQLFKLGDEYVVAVFQGKISDYDMVVKFRQYDKNTNTWSRFRQPKHIHWTVDVLIKQEYNKTIVNKFLVNLLNDWGNYNIIPNLKSVDERNSFLKPDNLLRYVFIEAEKYDDTKLRGEYPIAFLILISRILMVQERTNREDAYMFKHLLESLKEHKDLYTVISKATFNGR